VRDWRKRWICLYVFQQIHSHTMTTEQFSTFKVAQLYPCQPTKVALESGLYSRSDLANSVVEAGANVQRSWSRLMGRMLNKLMLEVYSVVSQSFIHMIASVSIYDCSKCYVTYTGCIQRSGHFFKKNLSEIVCQPCSPLRYAT